MSYKSQMHGGGESNSGIVPAKLPNEGQGGPQEVVEERPLTKENTGEPNPHRTPGRGSGPSGLDRVREAARRDRELYPDPDACFVARIQGRNRVR